MSILVVLLFVLILLAAWVLILLGLPGTWIMLAAAIVYALLAPVEPPRTLGWPAVIEMALLAGLGEVIELIAGAAGASRSGASRRGMVGAVGGSLVGAVVGLFVGLPIPLVGSLLAAILFAGLGALGGTMLAERSLGRELRTAWQIGKAAFWGRMLGTVCKAAIGLAMILVALVALFL